MKIIVGDEFGLIKCVDVGKKQIESKYGEIKKKNGVICIDNLYADNRNILGILYEYKFQVLNWSDKNLLFEKNDDLGFTSMIIKHTIDFSSCIISKNDGKINILRFDEENKVTNDEIYDPKIKNLYKITNSYITNEIFCLSKDVPVSIYNLDKNIVTWKAKNLPHDELDLKIPIWDVDLACSKNNTNVFYTATAYGEIRKYDKSIKNRPISNNKIYDRKINRMVLSKCEFFLVVGDGLGNIFMLDTRKNYTIVKSLKGSSGAIKDIRQTGNEIFVSCGYDRFLRVFNFRTYEDLPQIYLKNKLNAIFPLDLVIEKESEEDKSDDMYESNDFEDEEDDEIEESENFDDN